MATVFDQLTDLFIQRKKALSERDQAARKLPGYDYFMPKSAKKDLEKRQATMEEYGVPGMLQQAAQETYQNPAVNAAIGFTPVIGDLQSAYEAVKAAKEGQWAEAGLNALGVLPFVPAMGGMIKSAAGRIPETTQDVNKFADFFETKGKALGHEIQTGSSNVSNSRYVTFKNPEGLDYQIRISGHGDRHPYFEGERFSIDPDSRNTFEEAKNWLKERDINLDKKVKTTNNNEYKSIFYGEKASEINKLRNERNLPLLTNKEIEELGLINDL